MPGEATSGLIFRTRPAAGDPAGALVLLHGRGVDENDLFPVLSALDPDARLLGLTPRAPLTPPGHAGNHWYVVRRIGFPDPATFAGTYERLGNWLDSVLAEHGLDPGRAVIGGFSQGAVMAYALGLGPGRPRPAGILAMSGFVPNVEGWEIDPANAAGLPVAIAHGSLDPVIEVGFGREARDILERAGAKVSYHESPVPHTIDPAVIGDLRAWVEEALRPL